MRGKGDYMRLARSLCSDKFPGTTVWDETLSLCSLLCVFPHFSAQDWAKQKLEKSTRHREWVTVKQRRTIGGGVTSLIRKVGQIRAPVVVGDPRNFRTFPDWGRNWLPDEFAEAGYIAICAGPAVGEGPERRAEPGLWIKTAVGQAIRDLPADQIAGRHECRGGILH